MTVRAGVRPNRIFEPHAAAPCGACSPSAPFALAAAGSSFVLKSADFVGWTPAMLARLVYDRRNEELCRVQFTYREPVEPRFVAAGEAVQLRPPNVPEFDVHAVRPALAEQQDAHPESLCDKAKKKQSYADCSEIAVDMRRRSPHDLADGTVRLRPSVASHK
jgi:hypothetical protein